MQAINRPPPVIEAQPDSVTFKGGRIPRLVYQHECLPFAVGTTLTVAVLTFDILTDWLAWRAFTRWDIAALVETSIKENNATYWGLEGLYRNLPEIYLALCLVASIIYLVELGRLLRELVLQRRKVTEHLDGIPFKGTRIERYTREVTLLLLVIVQDLLLSLILIACQALVSCTFLLHINSAIFVLSASATCISLIWKLGQVTWRSGCLGQREDYHCTITQGIVRIASVLLILGSLAAASLNLILLVGPPSGTSIKNQQNNALWDKLDIDQWLQHEHLVLAVSRKQQDPNRQMIPTKNPQQMYVAYSNVIRLKYVADVVGQSPENQTYSVPCGEHILPFLEPEHQRYMTRGATSPVWACNVVVRMNYVWTQHTLHYHMMYRLYNILDDNLCVAGDFTDSVTQETYDAWVKPQEDIITTTELDSVTTFTWSPIHNFAQHPDRPSIRTPQLYLHLTTTRASIQTSKTATKCALHFIPDALKFPLFPCDPDFLPEMSLTS